MGGHPESVTGSSDLPQARDSRLHDGRTNADVDDGASPDLDVNGARDHDEECFVFVGANP